MGFVSNYLKNLPAVALGKQPRLPLLFSLYLTHRCELNCSYCCDGEGKRFKEEAVPELSTPEIRRLLQILRVATDTLDLTGGEPLLRHDLEEILRFAKTIGFTTILNTKGIGLHNRPALLETLDVLVISIDSLSPGTLGRMVGRDEATADRVLAALRFACAHRDPRRTAIVLSIVATPATLGEVGAILRFARENGLGIQLSPEITGVRVNPQLPGNTAYNRLIGTLLARKRKHQPVLGVPEYLRGIRDFPTFPCHPLLMPVIRPDGRMYYPCLESKNAEIDLLQEGDYFRALDRMRARHGEPPSCRSCCHIFCHMAISLLQRHPLSAFRELSLWRTLYA